MKFLRFPIAAVVVAVLMCSTVGVAHAKGGAGEPGLDFGSGGGECSNLVDGVEFEALDGRQIAGAVTPAPDYAPDSSNLLVVANDGGETLVANGQFIYSGTYAVFSNNAPLSIRSIYNESILSVSAGKVCGDKPELPVATRSCKCRRP